MGLDIGPATSRLLERHLMMLTQLCGMVQWVFMRWRNLLKAQ